MFILFLLLVSAYADTPCPTRYPSPNGYATLDISESQCKAAADSRVTWYFEEEHLYTKDNSPTGCVFKNGNLYWVDPGFRTEHSYDNTYSLTDENGNVDVTQHTPGFPSYGSLGQPCSTDIMCVKCMECDDPDQKVAYTYKQVSEATDTFSYAISRHMCIALYDRSDVQDEDQYVNTHPNDWQTPFGCGYNSYNSDYNYYQWTKHKDVTTCGGTSYLSCLTVETATCEDPCGVNHYFDGSGCQPCDGSHSVSNAYLPYKSHTYQHCVPAHWSTCGELPNLPETATHGDGQIGQRYVSGDKTTRKCEVCPIGYAAPFGTGNTDTECNLCSGGYGGNGTHCNKCPVDKYQAHKSLISTPCADKACPKGQGVGDSDMENTCHVCQAGTFSNSDTTGQCVTCDGANFYTADANGDFTLTGAEQCLECPAGEHNSDSNSRCCPLGQVASGSSCVPCTGCNCIVGTVLTIPGQFTADIYYSLRGMNGNPPCPSYNTITEAHVPEETFLGPGAFKDLQDLAIVQMPKMLTISTDSFYNTPSLGAVELPKITTIGARAFFKSSITSITAPLVTTLGDYAFRESGIQAIDFPELVTVPQQAFYQTQSLTTVNLPKATTIGTGAFFESSMTSITAPLVTTLGDFAFKGTNIQAIDFPDLVTVPPSGVSQVASLTTVNLPKATTIDTAAFYRSTAIYINAPLVTTLGINAFKESTVQLLRLPEVSNPGADAWLDSAITLRVTDDPWDPVFCSGIKSTFRDKCSCS